MGIIQGYTRVCKGLHGFTGVCKSLQVEVFIGEMGIIKDIWVTRWWPNMNYMHNTCALFITKMFYYKVSSVLLQSEQRLINEYPARQRSLLFLLGERRVLMSLIEQKEKGISVSRGNKLRDFWVKPC